MLIRIGERPGHAFDQPLGLLSDCHRRIEFFLGALAAIAREAAGGPLTPAQTHQVDAALTYFSTAAPRHTADEEDSLFPRMRASSSREAARVLDLVDRLAHDHADANAHHHAVDGLGRRWLADGALGPADFDELRARLAALQSLYDAHIAIEDREVFPVAARTLSEQEIREIGREMAQRRSLTARR